MSIQEFIFSNKRSDRIKQHLLFWAIWYPYITLTHAANPMGYPDMSFFRNPVYTFSESFFVVFTQAPTVYLMLYLVFPRLILKKKYLAGFAWIILLWLLCGALNVISLANVMQPFLSMVLPPDNVPKESRTEGMSFFMAIMATNKGAYSITASALMLKFGKHWYHHQHRSLQLQKENTEAQLQLLTAQVHPHFLFNTLNNIYSKTQKESPEGSQMIMGLSDILRYVLYEGRKAMVPLEKELQMILEYINLERLRYGNKLDLHYLVTGNTKDLYIAPLLLLPFVENCFKHGTSSVLQNPWINLTVEVKETRLEMKLMNGKSAAASSASSHSGIGIDNVRQRLNMLYKDKNVLEIREEEDVFVVDLTLHLTRVAKVESTSKQPTTEILYA